MPRRGTPTEIPGITRDGTKWILRAVMKGSNGRRLERQKMIEGAHEKPKRAEMRQLEDELEKLREELRQEANAEANGMSLKETVGDFAPRWLEHTATTGKTRKHVVEKRLRHLETFILPNLGDKELRALRRSDVAAWMQSVASLRQPNGKLYGRVTLMGAWSTLRAMLRRAVILRDLEHDATSGFVFDIGEHMGGESRPEKKAKDALTLDEVGRLIEAAKDEAPDVRAMIVVQVATGMRFCEVSALEWRDIHLEQAFLRIERSQVEGSVGPPKTESTRRRVYLAETVVDVLRSHKAAQEAEPVVGELKGLVFPSKAGTYRSPAIMTKPLRRCCAIAGIDKKLSSHSLRRTANDLLRRANGDTVTRAMIGHATSEMTRLYSTVTHEERAQAHAAAFGDVLAKAVGAKGGTLVSPIEN
jgi:integrase